MKAEPEIRPAVPGRQLPTLEDDISEIQELDRLRRDAKAFRDRGVAALSSVIAQDEILRALKANRKVSSVRQKDVDEDQDSTSLQFPRSFSDSYGRHWGCMNSDEPAGLFPPAVADLAADKNLELARATRRETIDRIQRRFGHDLPSNIWQDLKDEGPTSAIKRQVGDLTLEKLFSQSKSKKSGPRRLPILEVARVMQDLVRHPDTVFTHQSFICYFALVRELYHVVAPDWKAGSATAIHGGVASAYMTSECVRALSSFARTLDTTAQVLKRAVGARKEAHELSANSQLLSPQWVLYEQKRILLSLVAYLRENEANIAFRVSLKDICKDLKRGKSSCWNALEKIIEQFLDDVKKSVQQAHKGISSARKEIDAFGSNEESQVARFLANAATQVADEVLRNGEEAIRSIQTRIDQASPRNLEPIEDIADMLARQASQIRSLLKPSLGFLESILDRELTRASLGSEVAWNPAELAFSAAALSALGHHVGDARLPMARRILERSLTRDGDFPMARVLESDFLGYGLVVVRAEILRALAQLLEASDAPIDANLVQKMLERFRLTRIEESGDQPDRFGWTHDNPRFPAKKLRWITGIAILALDRIVRMLDLRINSRVLRHFSVKDSSDLEYGPSLENLFYADYGMALDATEDDLKLGRMESVAYDLLQIYCHVKGEVPLPDLAGQETVRNSAVLYGPPGTGKTTLVEAVAKSAGVPLVVVTPSDIVVSGEAGLERRARAVFTALHALSRSVILFDEFEPVLRSRLQKTSEKTSIFHFLTPGMLPKLKDLHVAASSRRVGFFLVTNLLGELDDAAIRSGRFDKHIGVFPPNPTARSGQLMRVFLSEARDRVLVGDPTAQGTKKEEKNRFLEVIAKTCFGSMGRLAQRGLFLPSKLDHRGSILEFIEEGPSGLFSAPDIDMKPEYLWIQAGGEGVVRYSEKEIDLWSRLHSWELTLWEVLLAWSRETDEGGGLKMPESIQSTLEKLRDKVKVPFGEFSLPLQEESDVLSWIRESNGLDKGPREYSSSVMLPAYRELHSEVMEPTSRSQE
ncbi:MAG: ATP-binding protein [Deltaproteobacteria bacterium]|nr:ATP-binding protein [Deltaproteobacteria bacterium]